MDPNKKGSRKVGLKSPLAKPRPPDAHVTLQGWLLKQGSDGLMLWKRRWFVLSEYCLYYYKDQEERDVLGSILLPSYRISPVGPEERVFRKFAFKAEHANMRTYVFAADNHDAMVHWMNALSLAAILQNTSNETDRRQLRSSTSVSSTPLNRTPDEGDSGFHGSSSNRSLHQQSHLGLGRLSSESLLDDSGIQPVYINAPPKPRRLNSSVEESPDRNVEMAFIPIQVPKQPARPHSADFLETEMPSKPSRPSLNRPKSSLGKVENSDYWTEERYAEQMRNVVTYQKAYVPPVHQGEAYVRSRDSYPDSRGFMSGGRTPVEYGCETYENRSVSGADPRFSGRNSVPCDNPHTQPADLRVKAPERYDNQADVKFVQYEPEKRLQTNEQAMRFESRVKTPVGFDHDYQNYLRAVQSQSAEPRTFQRNAGREVKSEGDRRMYERTIQQTSDRGHRNLYTRGADRKDSGDRLTPVSVGSYGDHLEPRFEGLTETPVARYRSRGNNGVSTPSDSYSGRKTPSELIVTGRKTPSELLQLKSEKVTAPLSNGRKTPDDFLSNDRFAYRTHEQRVPVADFGRTGIHSEQPVNYPERSDRTVCRTPVGGLGTDHATSVERPSDIRNLNKTPISGLSRSDQGVRSLNRTPVTDFSRCEQVNKYVERSSEQSDMRSTNRTPISDFSRSDDRSLNRTPADFERSEHMRSYRERSRPVEHSNVSSVQSEHVRTHSDRLEQLSGRSSVGNSTAERDENVRNYIERNFERKVRNDSQISSVQQLLSQYVRSQFTEEMVQSAAEQYLLATNGASLRKSGARNKSNKSSPQGDGAKPYGQYSFESTSRDRSTIDTSNFPENLVQNRENLVQNRENLPSRDSLVRNRENHENLVQNREILQNRDNLVQNRENLPDCDRENLVQNGENLVQDEAILDLSVTSANDILNEYEKNTLRREYSVTLKDPAGPDFRSERGSRRRKSGDKSKKPTGNRNSGQRYPTLARQDQISLDIKKSSLWSSYISPTEAGPVGISSSHDNLLEASRREEEEAGFVRSKSARLPSKKQPKGGHISSKEESMTRLLEWKQRMLQSPLTKKTNCRSSDTSSPLSHTSTTFKTSKPSNLTTVNVAALASDIDGASVRSHSSRGRRSRPASPSSDEDVERNRPVRRRSRRSNSSGKSRRSVDSAKSNPSPSVSQDTVLPEYENIPYLRQKTEEGSSCYYPSEKTTLPGEISTKTEQSEPTKFDSRTCNDSSLIRPRPTKKSIWSESDVVKEFSYEYISESSVNEPETSSSAWIRNKFKTVEDLRIPMSETRENLYSSSSVNDSDDNFVNRQSEMKELCNDSDAVTESAKTTYFGPGSTGEKVTYFGSNVAETVDKHTNYPRSSSEGGREVEVERNVNYKASEESSNGRKFSEQFLLESLKSPLKSTRFVLEVSTTETTECSSAALETVAGDDCEISLKTLSSGYGSLNKVIDDGRVKHIESYESVYVRKGRFEEECGGSSEQPRRFEVKSRGSEEGRGGRGDKVSGLEECRVEAARGSEEDRLGSDHKSRRFKEPVDDEDVDVGGKREISGLCEEREGGKNESRQRSEEGIGETGPVIENSKGGIKGRFSVRGSGEEFEQEEAFTRRRETSQQFQEDFKGSREMSETVEKRLSGSVEVEHWLGKGAGGSSGSGRWRVAMESGESTEGIMSSNDDYATMKRKEVLNIGRWKPRDSPSMEGNETFSNKVANIPTLQYLNKSGDYDNNEVSLRRMGDAKCQQPQRHETTGVISNAGQSSRFIEKTEPSKSELLISKKSDRYGENSLKKGKTAEIGDKSETKTARRIKEVTKTVNATNTEMNGLSGAEMDTLDSNEPTNAVPKSSNICETFLRSKRTKDKETGNNKSLLEDFHRTSSDSQANGTLEHRTDHLDGSTVFGTYSRRGRYKSNEPRHTTYEEYTTYSMKLKSDEYDEFSNKVRNQADSYPEQHSSLYQSGDARSRMLVVDDSQQYGSREESEYAVDKRNSLQEMREAHNSEESLHGSLVGFADSILSGRSTPNFGDDFQETLHQERSRHPIAPTISPDLERDSSQIAENLYMPMTPARQPPGQASRYDEIYVEMSDDSSKRRSDAKVEPDSDHSHYDFLYKSSTAYEPVYMELPLKEKPPAKSEETPASRNPRFSLSDTFRPASYYLGYKSRKSEADGDSSDSDIVSPPPIPAISHVRSHSLDHTPRELTFNDRRKPLTVVRSLQDILKDVSEDDLLVESVNTVKPETAWQNKKTFPNKISPSHQRQGSGSALVPLYENMETVQRMSDNLRSTSVSQQSFCSHQRSYSNTSAASSMSSNRDPGVPYYYSDLLREESRRSFLGGRLDGSTSSLRAVPYLPSDSLALAAGLLRDSKTTGIDERNIYESRSRRAQTPDILDNASRVLQAPRRTRSLEGLEEHNEQSSAQREEAAAVDDSELWDEDTLWRANLRRASIRHARTQNAPQGQAGTARTSASPARHHPREQCACCRRKRLPPVGRDAPEEERFAPVGASPESRMTPVGRDSRSASRNDATIDRRRKGQIDGYVWDEKEEKFLASKGPSLDREKLRQWDMMSSAAVNWNEQCSRGHQKESSRLGALHS